MASAVRHNRTASYGSVAYAPSHAYEGSEAPARRRDKGPQLRELPLVRPRAQSRQQVESRVRVVLRPREEISFLPVVGFIVAACMAVMIIMSYSKLNSVYADTVQVRSELTQLQQEETRLLAEYEEVFDRAALEKAVAQTNGSLTEARNSQRIYVDLSEADNAVVYHNGSENSILKALRELWSAITE